MSRLEGHEVRLLALDADAAANLIHGYVIENVANEGKPLIGRVQLDGSTLNLLTRDGTVYRLTGPLARQRIAGPGYKIWVLGRLEGQPSTHGVSHKTNRSREPTNLWAKRIGILAPPAQAKER